MAEDQNQGALKAELVIPICFRRIPPDQEAIESERFEAYLRTRELAFQQEGKTTEEDDELENRLQRIEQKLDALAGLIRNRPQPMQERWTVLGENEMELRLGPGEPQDLSTGDLVHLSLLLPTRSPQPVELLARVSLVKETPDGRTALQLSFEAIGEPDQDQIVRTAFQAQRLGRRTK